MELGTVSRRAILLAFPLMIVSFANSIQDSEYISALTASPLFPVMSARVLPLTSCLAYRLGHTQKPRSSHLVRAKHQPRSLELGPAANHESWRQRVSDQVLPDTRRSSSAGYQRRKDQVHVECRHQIQGRASQESCRRRKTVCDKS